MKKILAFIFVGIFALCLIGCNKNTNTYSSEKLVKELRLLKNNKESSTDPENYVITIDDNNNLSEIIKKMNVIEFQKFASNYKSISFKKYTFVLFEDDICIVVKYSEDCYNIIEVKILNNIIPSESHKEQLVKGLNVVDVVSLMGYPYMVTMSEDNSLSFKLTNGEIIRVIFNDNMRLLDVIHIDFESIKDPSYDIDDKCGSNDEKTTIENAILICENMSFDEVVTLIGKPQRSFGSGAIWYEWDMEENKLLQIMFASKSFEDNNLYVVKYYIK